MTPDYHDGGTDCFTPYNSPTSYSVQFFWADVDTFYEKQHKKRFKKALLIVPPFLNYTFLLTFYKPLLKAYHDHRKTFKPRIRGPPMKTWTYEELEEALKNKKCVQRCSIDQHYNAVHWTTVTWIDKTWHENRYRIVFDG